MTETKSAEDSVLTNEMFHQLTANDPHGVNAAAFQALQWFTRRSSGPVPNAPDADVFVARELQSALEAAVTAQKETSAELLTNARIVLRGFDETIFVRNIAHDYQSDWAIRALPFVVALAKLAAACKEMRCIGATAGKDAHAGGCGWTGTETELSAQSCPRCDGRVENC